MSEHWRDIPGFDCYQASSDGQIRSLPIGRMRGVVLRPSITKKGYRNYALSVNGASKYRQGHRLVLEAFVGPCPEGMEACHNNGNPGDNRLENLRWDTRSSNSLDRLKHAKFRPASTNTFVRGHRHPRFKWLDVDIERMRDIRAAGCTVLSIARHLGAASGYVSDILACKRRS